MASLSIFLSLIAAFLVASGVVITLAARAVGTSRRKFSAVIGPLILLFVAGIIVNAVAAMVPASQPVGILVISVFSLIVLLGLPFTLFKRTYQLSTARTFAPWGAYVGTQMVAGLLVLFAVQPFVFEAYIMPTASMTPTIQVSDRFLVNRLRTPQRWDVIAFWQANRMTRVVWVKRLVGLPGERIRFEGGNLYVNDQQVAAPQVMAGKLTAGYDPTLRIPARYRDGETITLGPDEMFVIGDNLPLSSDSRSDGPEKRSSYCGVAESIYWPPSRWSILR